MFDEACAKPSFCFEIRGETLEGKERGLVSKCNLLSRYKKGKASTSIEVERLCSYSL